MMVHIIIIILYGKYKEDIMSAHNILLSSAMVQVLKLCIYSKFAYNQFEDQQRMSKKLFTHLQMHVLRLTSTLVFKV